MNKFNLPRRNIQKERRQKRAERRKQKARSTVAVKAHSGAEDSCNNSTALALKVSSTNVHSGYLSGKNKAKLQKKWRRAQKEALQSGLVTMHDIEMMALDEGAGTDEGSVQPSLPKSKKKFSMKKRAKLRSKSSSSKEEISEPAAISSVDADGEDAMMQ